jgi:hypothetical protein
MDVCHCLLTRRGFAPFLNYGAVRDVLRMALRVFAYALLLCEAIDFQDLHALQLPGPNRMKALVHRWCS